MEHTIFSLGTSICLLLSILMLFLIVKGLGSALKKRGDSPKQIRATVSKVSLYLVAWLLIISGVALTGFFSNFSLPPRLFLVLIAGFTIMLSLTFSKKVTALLAVIPPSWLISIQFFRVPVELMLWLLFVEGIAPEQMTFEGRNWDILVGITAPIFGYFCFKQGGWGRKVAIWWNIGGLALLCNILVVAILSFPTPFRVFMNEPANTMVATFPMILLPAVLVTIAYGMHFFSLRQLIIHKNMFKNQ